MFSLFIPMRYDILIVQKAIKRIIAHKIIL